MPAEREEDVVSPIDLRTAADAEQWANEVLEKRPSRPAFFQVFAAELKPYWAAEVSFLELGSGPGYLAQYLLSSLGKVRYTALDFSDAMHTLARKRLGESSDSVNFLTRDFLDPTWANGLGHYSAVASLQAVHELRHKRRAPTLYRQVHQLLRREGVLLVCDHFCGPGGMNDSRLFMSEAEHADALAAAGLSDVTCLHKEGGMVLFRAKPA
jgi:SAM-dependent methyltransferase